MHLSFSYKLLTQFPRYSGSRNWALRFSEDEYNSLENVFQQTEAWDRVFWNYKKFDHSIFREALNTELLKYDLNNVEYDTFQEILVSLLHVYAPLKKKHLRANHASFVTKELRKVIMQRTRLRNIYLKQRTEPIRLHIISKEINVLTILKKSQRFYFESLDVKFFKDNKKFWKEISSLFSSKIKSKKKITHVENDDIYHIENTRSSLIHLHGFQLLVLLP